METINGFHTVYILIETHALWVSLTSLCSESVLELSIMPKDEDVLQLVSVRLSIFDFSHTPTHTYTFT